MKLLLATAIDKDHVNNLGWTALLEAVILGDGGAAHTEIVRFLVEAGANVNIADRDGVTPLAHAKQSRLHRNGPHSFRRRRALIASHVAVGNAPSFLRRRLRCHEPR